jgi:pimeloyl-ACP methyl ester carboxylesterase
MKTLLKVLGFALSGLLIIALLLVLIVFGYRAYLQQRDADALPIHTSNGINEAGYVRIGGIDQWLQIRGDDVGNPVLLLLNGGPGVSWIRATQSFRPWEKHFTFVQWDQRGAGKTFAASGETIAPTMTMARMTSDAIEVIEYLRAHLKKDKVILLGHSWGSILGVHVAKERPGLLYCYVGTGQVESMPKMLRTAYAAFLAQARRDGNAQAIRELEVLGLPPYAHFDQYATLFRWSGPDRAASLRPKLRLPLGGFAAPGYSIADAYNLLRGAEFSEHVLFPVAAREDLLSLGLDFKVPVIFIEGADDQATPTADAMDYFDQIKAPNKDFVVIPGAGHFVLFEEPDTFLKEMLPRVKPLVGSAVARLSPGVGWPSGS